MEKLLAETIDRIKSLKSTGLSGYEVARLLNVGKSSVYKYTRQKSFPRWTEEEIEYVIDCYARGVPVKKIAAAVGRSEAAVKHIMHKHRRYIRHNQEIKIASHLILKCLFSGLPPGKALRQIRRQDLLGRTKADKGG